MAEKHFGVIVVGHGAFGTGLKNSIELIFGLEEKISFIDFEVGITPDELKAKIQGIIEENQDIGTIILTDLKGGTPFNISAGLSKMYNNVEVLSGCSIPMILQTLEIREEMKLSDSIESILENSKSEIVSFKDELNKKNKMKENEEDEGI